MPLSIVPKVFAVTPSRGGKLDFPFPKIQKRAQRGLSSSKLFRTGFGDKHINAARHTPAHVLFVDVFKFSVKDVQRSAIVYSRSDGTGDKTRMRAVEKSFAKRFVANSAAFFYLHRSKVGDSEFLQHDFAAAETVVSLTSTPTSKNRVNFFNRFRALYKQICADSFKSAPPLNLQIGQILRCRLLPSRHRKRRFFLLVN